MSKMINTFLLKDFVISHALGLRDLIITAETDGYQAMYNILVRHHPNLSNKHKVQTVYPQQGANNSFASHVKQVQQYLAAERARGTEYTDQEVLALTIRTLHDKYTTEFLNKAEKETSCSDPSFKLPFELRLCAVSATFTEWAEELGLQYSPSATTQKKVINKIESEEQEAQVSDDIIDVMAETYVNRINDDPSAPRCDFCGLPHMGQTCHKLINVAVGNRIFKQRPQLERQILAENAMFPTFTRRNQQSGRGRGNHRPSHSGGRGDNRRTWSQNNGGKGQGRGRSNKNRGTDTRARRIHSLAEEIAKLQLDEATDWDVDENEEEIKQIFDKDKTPREYIRMFQLEDLELEAAFLDDDDSITVMTSNDLQVFDNEMEDMGLALEPRSGGILSIHPVMDHDADPYDPFRQHMLQSDEMSLEAEQQQHEVNRIQGSDQTFQVDNGSATTTTPFSHLVSGYTEYPLNKRPTLTSATQHTIQSHGKGRIQFETNLEGRKKIVTKVTPGIAHNIVSPAHHLEANKDRY